MAELNFKDVKESVGDEIFNSLLIAARQKSIMEKKLGEAKEKGVVEHIEHYTNSNKEANLVYNKSLEVFKNKMENMGAQAADIINFVQKLNPPAAEKKIINPGPFDRI